MSTDLSPRDDQLPSFPLPMAVVVHLSGSLRGTTERLNGDLFRIGTHPDSDIHLSADKEAAVAPRHAELRREGSSWRIKAEPGQSVEVNGGRVGEAELTSGDILQIGEYGPLIRFRIYRGGSEAYKSMLEAFADCVDCARYGGDGALERTLILMGGIPKELTRETSPFARLLVILLAVLVVGMIALAWHSQSLERQLETEQLKVRGLAEMLAQTESRSLKRGELESLRRSFEADIEGATSRVEALEAGADAPRRLLSEYANSVAFVQGAFSFYDGLTGLPLRFVGLGPDGTPLTNPAGEPLVSLEGDGPIIESLFTGTAFVATEDGLLVTNRHVAIPWEGDRATQLMVSQGLVPRMRRLVVYVAGERQGFPVTLVRASDTADLAVLRCTDLAETLVPIPLADEPPVPGDEILVMGYPTGIRALVARADETFVSSLMEDENIDFWTIARRLAEGGFIAPLATRGIVGQVTPSRVVYDAETTSGGSGGPAINLDGKVVAVNAAILPEFGGSNLGVPAAHVRDLLRAVSGDEEFEGDGERVGGESGER